MPAAAVALRHNAVRRRQFGRFVEPRPGRDAGHIINGALGGGGSWPGECCSVCGLGHSPGCSTERRLGMIQHGPTALAAEKAAHVPFGRRGRAPRGAGEIYGMRNSASFGNGVRSRSWCLSRNSLLFSIKVGITAREWGRKESHTARKHRSTATLADSARGLAAPLPHRHRDSIAPATTHSSQPLAAFGPGTKSFFGNHIWTKSHPGLERRTSRILPSFVPVQCSCSPFSVGCHWRSQWQGP